MTITLEVDSASQEQLVRRYHALVTELADLADTAPDGEVIDVLEGAVLERGRDTLRATLQEAVQRRIDTAEKKGRCCAPARAVGRGKTAGRANGNS